MRVLCITQNLPGELEPMAAFLAASDQNQVFMASLRQRHNVSQPGIRRIILKKCNAAKYDKDYLGYWQLGLNTAANAEKSFSQALKQDFYPDLVLTCASNGIAFAIPQIFTESFLAVYADTRLLDYPITGKGFYEARRQIQACQIMRSHVGFVRYARQRDQLDGLDQRKIHDLSPFVDTEFFKPAPAAGEAKNLVGIVSGVLSERQLAIFWSQLKEMLAKLPDCRIALLAEGGLRGWRWEEMAANLPAPLASRLSIEYSPLNETWRNLLLETAYLLCPLADMSVGQRLLEAMACEVPVVGGVTTLDFLKFGHNCLGFQMFRDQSLAAITATMLAQGSKDEIRRIAAKARADILRDFDQRTILPVHMEMLLQAMQKHGEERPGPKAH